MGIFIRVEIDPSLCTGIEKCGQCLRVCPVTIFEGDSAAPAVNESNEDECTLCELCLQACQPRAITIRKLYEE